MIWHLIKYWITFILAAFYKRIQGKNIEYMKVKGPVILALNHPNAFTDPIAISYVSYPLRLKYMARGDAFKPGITAWLLEQIGIIPIFRIQDGGLEGLRKNDEAYRRVNALLKKNAKVIVFAEGLCVQERRLRPLKKGVARMVFGAYEALNNDQLIVLPVGINYSQPNRFRSDVFYNIGEPIAVRDFIAAYKENPAKTNLAFIQLLQSKMKALITHIEDKNNDEAVYQVEALCKNSLIKAQGLNPENLADDFTVTKQITAKVNQVSEENPALLDQFKTNAGIYFAALKKNRLQDALLDPSQNKKITPLYLGLRILVLLAGFPLYGFGLLGNYLPYFLSAKISRKIVKRKLEFYSSFFIGVAMLVFLINYLLWFFILKLLTPGLLWALALCVLFALSAWFCLRYRPFLQETAIMLRIANHKKIAAGLSNQRKDLISLINKF
ncbi:MAG TPA: 1-acyl-sn-glycerol-3-phosphate acyltransferase [Bacteroidia bacterium]|nr:1-acyl-sn-glycerol-3-phosphate acyltransferase [Bacteroidia bacterium]